MGLKVLNPLIKTVAKKAYVAPKAEVRTLESLGLKMEQLTGDVVQVKNKILTPSGEKLKQLMERQGLQHTALYEANGSGIYLGNIEMGQSYINKNNSMFLEEIINRFPLKRGNKVNTDVQKRMLYLQDINHSQYADKRKFLDQFLKDVDQVEAIKATDGSLLYSDSAVSLYSKKAILQAQYNNPDRYKELTDLLGLYKEGKVPRHIVETFFPKAHFHALPKGDMLKILRGEHYFPELTELTELAVSKVEFGEVFSVGEKMFVKTKDCFKALKIDKVTYEKLFPAIERYSISQNGLMGNCGKIASWNAMIKNPNSRIQLYDMFEQTQHGVRVTMHNPKFSTEFDFNDLSMLYGEKNLHGSIGHKMLEYTYDMNKFGKIDINGGGRAEMISDITGLYNIPDAIRHNQRYSDKLISINSNGIYTHNGGLSFDDNLNIGSTKKHYYSTTNLKNGLWQNPWTGIEEITLGKYSCTEGSAQCYDFTLKDIFSHLGIKLC